MRWPGRWSISRSAAERAGGDVLLVGLASLASAALSFVMVPLLARSLGLAPYGAFVQFQTTVDLVATVALLGLPYALLRYLPGAQRGDGAAALATAGLGAVGVAAVSSLVLLLLAPWIANSIFGGARSPVYACAVAIPLQVASLLFANQFRVRQRLGIFTLLTTSLSIGRLGAVAVAIRLGAGLDGVLLAFVGFQAFHALAALVGALLLEGYAAPRLDLLRTYLRFGAPTLPGVLSTWIVTMSDRYVLALHLGPAAVGLYHPAMLLGSLLQMLLVPFDVVLTAALAKTHNQGDHAGTRRLLERWTAAYAWLAFPAFIGISLLCGPVLSLMIGSAEAAAAAIVVPFAAASWLCYGLLILTASPVFFLRERTHMGAAVWGGAAILNLILNLLLVPRLGLLGAATGTLVSYVAALLLGWALAARLGFLVLPWRPFARSVAACVPMTIMLVLWAPANLLGAALAAVAGALVYLVAHWVLSERGAPVLPLLRAS